MGPDPRSKMLIINFDVDQHHQDPNQLGMSLHSKNKFEIENCEKPTTTNGFKERKGIGIVGIGGARAGENGKGEKPNKCLALNSTRAATPFRRPHIDYDSNQNDYNEANITRNIQNIGFDVINIHGNEMFTIHGNATTRNRKTRRRTTSNILHSLSLSLLYMIIICSFHCKSPNSIECLQFADDNEIEFGSRFDHRHQVATINNNNNRQAIQSHVNHMLPVPIEPPLEKPEHRRDAYNNDNNERSGSIGIVKGARAMARARRDAASAEDEHEGQNEADDDEQPEEQRVTSSRSAGISKTHIAALSDQWVELQCPLARELPTDNDGDDVTTGKSSKQLAGARSAQAEKANRATSSHPSSLAIIWSKNSLSMSPSPRYKVNGVNGSLVIAGAQPKLDEATFECALVQTATTTTTTNTNQSHQVTTNDDKSQNNSTSNWTGVPLKRHAFELSVLEAPRLAPFEFAHDATVGMRILLTCSILRGQQPISFVWLKDSQILHPASTSTPASSASASGSSSAASGSLQTRVSLDELHRQQLGEKLALNALSGLQASMNASKMHHAYKNKNKASKSRDSRRPFLNEDPLMDVANEPSSRKTIVNKNNNPRLDYVIYNAAEPLLSNSAQSSIKPLLSSMEASGQQNHEQHPTTAATSSGLLPILQDPSIMIRQTDDYSILSIEGLELKHSGRYTCSAQNEAARTSHSAELTINAPPSFLLEPRDTDLVSGQGGRLDCAATGQPRPLVSWHRARESGNQQWDYVPIYDNLRYSSLANGSLQMSNISQREQGFYLCSASNGFGPELTKLIRVTVHEPAKFATRFRSQELRLGERATVLCQASGESPVHIEWLDREGKPLDTAADKRFVIDNEPEPQSLSPPNITTSRLILTKASRQDTGHYTCQATNKFGSDRMVINLVVQHVPDRVAELKVTNVTSTTISLRWQPGASGNSPILSYLVQYQSDDPLYDLLAAAEPLKATSKAASFIEDGAHLGDGTTTTLNQGSPPSSFLRHSSLEALSSALSLSSPSDTTANSNGAGGGAGSSMNMINFDEAIDRTLVELTVEQATSHLVVKDLTPSCVYRLRLAPINKIGLGDFSDWIRAKTEEAAPLGSALKISAMATGPNSIKLSWLPPDRRQWNGPLIGFNIGYRPLDSSFEFNKTFEWSAPSLQSIIQRVSSTSTSTQSSEDQSQSHHAKMHAQLKGIVSALRDHQQQASISTNNTGSKSSETPTQVSGSSAPVSAGQNLNQTGHQNQISSSYYLLRQQLNQLLAFQQQELVAHLTNLQRSTTYLVWIQALNQRGLGPQSHAITIKTLDDVPPSAPSIKIQSSSSNSITLAWSLLNNFISAANQYSLFYRKLPQTGAFNPGTNMTFQHNNMHQTNGGPESLAAGHQPTAGQLVHPASSMASAAAPFIERTLTSQQLILAGNLFLGADQTEQPLTLGYNSPGSQFLSPLHQQHQPTSQQHYQQFVYTLDQLECGSVYELYMSTRNSVGKSEPSATVTTRTSGEPPLAPANKNNLFARIGYNDVLLNLASWSTGGCPLTHMSIIYKPAPPSPMMAASSMQLSQGQLQTLINSDNNNNKHQSAGSSNGTTIIVSPSLLATLNGASINLQQHQDQPTGRAAGSSSMLMMQNQHQAAMIQSPILSIKNLSPSNCYQLEILAHNSAGYTRAQYEFVTSNLNDSRSGSSRKEGIFRIDQRGTLIDSVLGDSTTPNNHLSRSPSLLDSASNHNHHSNFELHQQLAPLVFLFLCLVFLLISSTFCYYRFRFSWRDKLTGGGGQRHRRRANSLDGAPSLSMAHCHHGGPSSSILSQSSPGSVDKASMWRLHNNGPTNNNFGLVSNLRHHADGDDEADSPSSSTNHPQYNNCMQPANHLAGFANHNSHFAQSVSMRDFNLIGSGSGAQRPRINAAHNNNTLKGNQHLLNHHQHQNHQLHHTLNHITKHHQNHANHHHRLNHADELAPRMLTMRARLLSSTPYDELMHQNQLSFGSHSLGVTLNNQSNKLAQQTAEQENAYYQTTGATDQHQQVSSSYNNNTSSSSYNDTLPLPIQVINDSTTPTPNNNNYNTLECGQQQQETSWTSSGAMVAGGNGATNYAVPSASMLPAPIISSSETTVDAMGQSQPTETHFNGENIQNDTQTPPISSPFNPNHQHQSSIDVCIQEILNQEYQQQQHYAMLLQQQQQQPPRQSTTTDDVMVTQNGDYGPATRHQQQQSQHDNNNHHTLNPKKGPQYQSSSTTTTTSNCILESSSGSSSSGVGDLGCQQSDVGSSSTAHSGSLVANNGLHNNQFLQQSPPNNNGNHNNQLNSSGGLMKSIVQQNINTNGHEGQIMNHAMSRSEM